MVDGGVVGSGTRLWDELGGPEDAEVDGDDVLGETSSERASERKVSSAWLSGSRSPSFAKVD